MNRRVVVTVTDQSGKLVAAGGVNPVLPRMAEGPWNCCDDILARLDKLDNITKILGDLAENAELRARWRTRTTGTGPRTSS